jgi:hypothetical protein
MFKLLTENNHTICTANFGAFDNNSERSKMKALRYIENQKSAWESQSFSIGRDHDLGNLKIVEV